MKQYDSKILKRRIVRDQHVLDEIALKYGYQIGDLVKPIAKKPSRGGWTSRHREVLIRCCWKANRERPVFNGKGRWLENYEYCIAIDIINSTNGSLCVVLTSDGKIGYVLLKELEKVV